MNCSTRALPLPIMGSALLPLEPRIGRLPILNRWKVHYQFPSSPVQGLLTAKLLHPAPMRIKETHNTTNVPKCVLTYCYFLHQRVIGCDESHPIPSDPRIPVSDSSRTDQFLGGYLSFCACSTTEALQHCREFFLQTEGTTAHLLCLGSLRSRTYRRHEGVDGGLKRIPYPRDLLVYGEHKQNFRQKKINAFRDVTAHRLSNTGMRIFSAIRLNEFYYEQR